jgi:DNA-binding NarL/FixJ family response regulator
MSTHGTIRVVLVDDHAVIRAGLAQLIATADDIEVVGQAADGAAAIEQARALRPDVVLMDLQMPGVDGVSATREIVAAGIGVDVLVLTSYSDNERILDALDAGAVGYLLKDADPDDVLTGIRAVSRGRWPAAADRPRGRGADAGARRSRQQADRQAAGDQRAHRQGAPDQRLLPHRRQRPDAGRALGAAQRTLSNPRDRRGQVTGRRRSDTPGEWPWPDRRGQA